MTDDEGLKRPIGTVGPEEQLTPPTSESEAEAECDYDTEAGCEYDTEVGDEYSTGTDTDQPAHNGCRPTLGDQGL